MKNLEYLGQLLPESQRFWWPALSFLCLVFTWLAGMSLLVAFPALGQQSYGRVVEIVECLPDDTDDTDCTEKSIIEFPDATGRTHIASGDSYWPLGKEILVVYLPWGDPPLSSVTYDTAAGEEPRTDIFVFGLVIFSLPIAIVIGLVGMSVRWYVRYRPRLSAPELVDWWSGEKWIEIAVDETITKRLASKLSPGEHVQQAYKIKPVQYALAKQPGRLDPLGLAIAGLIWFGLSAAVGYGLVKWPPSLVSWLLNAGIPLVGLIMMFPFLRALLVGKSIRLVITNERKILFPGNNITLGSRAS